MSINLNNIKFSGNIKTYIPPIPYALQFDGVDEYINLQDKDAFSFNDGIGNDTPFTFATWINSSTLFGNMILGKRASGQAEYFLGFPGAGGGANNRLVIRLYNPGVTAYIGKSVTNSMIGYAGSWIHVAATYDGSKTEAGLKLYVNGSAVGISTYSGGGTFTGMVNGTAPLYIGSWALAGGQEFNGKIDELGIWSRELSSSEISDLYDNNNGLYIDPAGTFTSTGSSMGLDLEALYHMDAGTGTEVTLDFSGNGNTGTLINMEAGDWVDGKVQIP